MEVHKSAAARVFGVNPCRRRNEIFRRGAALSFLPSLLPPPFPALSSALTYNGCPATDPRLDPGKNIRLPLGSRPISPSRSLYGVEAIFYGVASKVNLTDGLRFPEGAFFSFPLWNACGKACTMQGRGGSVGATGEW